MKTTLLLFTAGLLVSSSAAASIANHRAKWTSSEESLSHDRANYRKKDVLHLEAPSSAEVSNKEIQIPLASPEVSEKDLGKSPSSPEVIEEDRRKPILSSEVSEDLQKPAMLEVSNQEIQIPLASREVLEKDLRRLPSSPEVNDKEMEIPLLLPEVEDVSKSPSSPEINEESSRKDFSAEVSEDSRKAPASSRLSDQEIQVPLASPEVIESDRRKSPSSPEVIEKDTRKERLSSEIFEDVRKPALSEISDQEIQVPLASSEDSENDHQNSPLSEIPDKDQNDEFYQNMASAMETAAQKVLEEKTDIISSSEVSEDLRKPSVPEIQKDQSSPSSTELSEKDLQNLYDICRYIASAFTKEEFSTRLKDSYPVWEVISSLLNDTYKAHKKSQTSTSLENNDNRENSLKWWEFIETTKRPSKAPRDESADDIGDWWKYIPDPKQPAKSPQEEPAVDVDVSSRYLPHEKRSTESPRKFIDDDDVESIPKGKSYPRRKIIQYRV